MGHRMIATSFGNGLWNQDLSSRLSGTVCLFGEKNERAEFGFG